MMDPNKPMYSSSRRALAPYKNLLNTQDLKPEERIRGTNLLLQLLLHAKKASAAEILVLTELQSNDSHQVIYKPTDQASGELSSIKGASISSNDFSLLLNCLQDRLFSWHEPNDNLYDLAHQQEERVLLAPLSPFRVMASVFAAKNGGTITLSLKPLYWDNIPPASSMLMLDAAYKEGFQTAVRRKNGIILANCATASLQITALAVLAALRPDAVIFPFIPLERQIEQILQLSKSYLVVLAYESLDPVDMLFSFLGLCATDNELYEQACSQLSLAFVHRRVRRTCSTCVRSTPVSSATLDRLPDVLRPLAKATYMFSRGCTQCGNAAYRGSVGLESLVAVDETLRFLLLRKSAAKEFSAQAYKLGVRSLLEDGIRKIYSGLTSFEQVFSVVSSISADFAAAAKEHITEDEDLQLTLAPEETSIEQVSSQRDRQPTKSPNKRRVLIVEDEIDQRDVLRLVFQSEGYEVVTAENGKDALDVLGAKNVDLIVSDVMMPVMNGKELLKAVREQTVFNKIPILILTAVENPEDEFSFLEQGADDYCKKNVKRKILMQRVEKLFERKKKENPVGHLLES